MSADKLMKCLRTPAKVASALDWKRMSGKILAIDIGTNGRMGLALASHPSYQEPVRTLKPLEVKLESRGSKQRLLAPSVTEQLQDIVKKHRVCAFVVSWPVQKEGRCGAACGKVLHTLDSLVAQTSSVVSPNRPLCLWDERHYHSEEDEWGRNPIYGRITEGKTLHIASEEQYRHDASSSVAADVWNDFCRKLWPEIYQEQVQEQRQAVVSMVASRSDEGGAELIENYDDHDSEGYIGMAV